MAVEGEWLGSRTWGRRVISSSLGVPKDPRCRGTDAPLSPYPPSRSSRVVMITLSGCIATEDLSCRGAEMH
ncbi:hypothetical protein TNCV_2853011 [Trichonephila clavipes]|uniref:Uncharacterized protein n=1 Tax=Trichonephila clavipes TaxID=2585209 RepID=A0A8X6RC29_TRICX|nr:hypothetical protein TNCV_2853011 [Trichonephila clavipes]